LCLYLREKVPHVEIGYGFKRRIEDRRCKIGGRSGGGSEIGSAFFRVLSVAKSLSSQSNLSTAEPFGWRLRWGNS